MRPERTSCGAPTMLSPQKPEAPPMRTIFPAAAGGDVIGRFWGRASMPRNPIH